MVRLVMILLGVDYLRSRWRGLRLTGWVSLILGIVIFIDALDSALYFPITPFACLLLAAGLATLAVDRNGVISTGHAALEAPDGVYISLYPGVEIDRSPNEFTRILQATHENDVPGLFQPDYQTESKAWCPSTVQVRIRNYDPERLRRFWEGYRQDTTYNLTHRNCSSSVSRALEAAIEGASARVWAQRGGWRPLLRLLTTPELWVAAQIRKRAATMAWTPGLTLDYARALSMLADPRPSGWARMARLAFKRMYRSRRQWREEQRRAPNIYDTDPTHQDGSKV